MITKAEKILGLFYGFVIGDTLGIPLTAFQDEWEMNQKIKKYPIFEYLEPSPSGIYSHLKKYQYSYPSQILFMMVDSILNSNKYQFDDKTILDIFKSIVQRNFLDHTQEYVKTDILFQSMAMKIIGNYDMGNYNVAVLDKFSSTPLYYLFPISLLQKNDYLFWYLQQEYFGFSYFTKKSQLFLINIIQYLFNLKDFKTINRNFLKHHFYKLFPYVPDNKAVVFLEKTIEALCVTDNFHDCLLKIINENNNIANEIGAIAGALSGLIYGIKNIDRNLIYENVGLQDIYLKCKSFIEWRNVLCFKKNN